MKYCITFSVKLRESDYWVLIFMEEILESEARFRGLQEPILQAIIKHQCPFWRRWQRDVVPITNQEYVSVLPLS